jgi:hypothetical protein
MVNNEQLDAELLAWKREKLDQGKFPCMCGHFESSHVKGMCIACHGIEGHTESSFLESESCFHIYKQMPNLDLIEWFDKHIDK